MYENFEEDICCMHQVSEVSLDITPLFSSDAPLLKSEQPPINYFLTDPITHLIFGATFYAYSSEVQMQQIDVTFPANLHRQLTHIFQNLPTSIIAVNIFPLSLPHPTLSLPVISMINGNTILNH